MDIAALTGLTQASAIEGLDAAAQTGKTGLAQGGVSTDGTLFDSFLDTAMANLKTTNNYLSDFENEEIRWALGETENTHDLTIALQKASSALQYTVAIRDRILEAYKEIMNIQI